MLRREDYAGVVPFDSFIAVSDFETYAALAEHIRYLEQNVTAYLRYFEWTKVFRKQSTDEHKRAHCHLCEYVHSNNHSSKVYYNIDTWWEGSQTAPHCVQFSLLVWWDFIILLAIAVMIATMVYIFFTRRSSSRY